MSTEDEKKVDEGTDVQDTSAETKKPDEHMIPQSRLNTVIQERDNATKRADALEKAAQDAEKQRLKEREDYKGLYETAQQEITDLKPKAEKLDTANETLNKVLEAQIAAIPEGKRSLVPAKLSTEDQLDWISQNRAILSKAKSFDYGAGSNGGGEPKTSVELTPEEEQIARDYGLSKEEYAKHKDKETA